MQPDAARISLMRIFLASQGYDAVIVRSPSAVLMLSGYWPSSADSFCLFRQTGVVTLIVPEDDLEDAQSGWADEIVTFPASVSAPALPTTERALPVFRRLLSGSGRETKYGYESGPGSLVALGQTTYPDRASAEMLRIAAPTATWFDCTDLLAAAMMWKTPRELDAVRLAAQVADIGLAAARDAIRIGQRECDIAATAVAAMLARGPDVANGVPCMGAARVLAGVRSSLGWGAAARSTTARINEGDPVIVEVRAGAGGFWSVAARTFFVGDPDTDAFAALEVARRASRAALDSIDLGVLGGEIDAAAETVWVSAGYEGGRRTRTGFGVGFHAGDSTARPVIANGSIDAVRAGQAFCLGASWYRTGAWGVTIADTVAFSRSGVETLTTVAAESERSVARATPETGR